MIICNISLQSILLERNKYNIMKSIKHNSNRTIFSLVSCLIFVYLIPSTNAAVPFVSFKPEANQIKFITPNCKTLNIMYSSMDYQGAIDAIKNLQADIFNVTDIKPQLVNMPNDNVRLIIGSIDKSPIIKELIKTGKINSKELKGKNEKFIITTLHNPTSSIKGNAIIIAGSDKRGTIYGIYELSKQIGVSPWNWWADVPVAKHKEIYIKDGTYTDGEPAIKYRGIFINDEWPAMGGWTTEKFGGFNSKMYAHVFELILRLKGNFLWPAMWSAAFYADDPDNSKTADEMGVIIGTSHHEPMGRNHQEWARNREKYGEWDYQKNQATIDDFFRKGIERMKNTEDVVTIGMRGDGDAPMGPNTDTSLLENIVKNQRKIIENVTGKPARKTSQVWALYSEVLEYYDKGMKIPDDAMILLCDDNWGDIRRLPELNSSKHSGGYGIYYHVDLHGAPRAYQWLNMTQIQHMWEQLQLTYNYGVDKMWILNVGDLKPMEFPINFFIDMAWDPKSFNAQNLDEYTKNFCAEQFGEEQAPEAARILNLYCKYCSRVTAEMLNENTYNLESGEYKMVTDEFLALETYANRQYTSLPENMKDAYKELILFPVQAMANLYDLYYSTAMNHKLANEKDLLANAWGDRVVNCFTRDSILCADYNHNIANGKWNHMMDQVHIGYKSWDAPTHNLMPAIYRVNPEEAKKGGYVFSEKNRVISMEAEHYYQSESNTKTYWNTIPYLGRTLSGISLMPYTQPVNSSSLTYRFNLNKPTDSVKVYVILGCTLPFIKGGQSFSIQIDNNKEQNINYNSDLTWANNYSKMYPAAAARIIESVITLELPKSNNTLHTLTIKPLAPGVVFNKIVIDCGGYEHTHLYMPESPYTRE